MRHRDLPSINVGIRLMGDYGDAQEYRDPHPELGYQGQSAGRSQRDVSSYIESKDNISFEVDIRVEDDASLDEWIFDNRGLEFHLMVDGGYMGKRYVSVEDVRQEGSGRRDGRGRHGYFTKFIGAKGPGTGQYFSELRRFVFSPIATGSVEDGTSVEEIALARALGTIEVVARWSEYTGHVFGPGRNGDGRQGRHTEHRMHTKGYPYSEISEEALKGRALSHSTSFSDAEGITRAGGRHGDGSRPRTRLLDRGRPVVSYLFKYRSMEGLKKEAVVERSPVPDYEDDVPKMETLPQHEIERLARVKLIQMKRDQDKQRQPLTALGTNQEARQNAKRRIDEVYDLTQEIDGSRPRKIFRMDPSVPVVDLCDE
ncbi:hypothetical protein ACHAQA_007308 [Verticillium albo-atrum]